MIGSAPDSRLSAPAEGFGLGGRHGWLDGALLISVAGGVPSASGRKTEAAPLRTGRLRNDERNSSMTSVTTATEHLTSVRDDVPGTNFRAECICGWLCNVAGDRPFAEEVAKEHEQNPNWWDDLLPYLCPFEEHDWQGCWCSRCDASNRTPEHLSVCSACAAEYREAGWAA